MSLKNKNKVYTIGIIVLFLMYVFTYFYGKKTEKRVQEHLKQKKNETNLVEWKDKNQKNKNSQKRKYKRPIRYKDKTKEGKQEYIRSCIVSFWVMAIIVQVIT